MPMGLSEASNILWRQRHLLELLLFKLEVEQTLLASGRLRWLAHQSGYLSRQEFGNQQDIRADQLSNGV